MLRQAARDSLIAVIALALLLVVATVLRDPTLLKLGSASAMARLMFALFPAYVSYIVPASLLCGVMVSLSRMAADAEILAMRSGGMGLGVLLVPIGVLGAAAVGATAFASFDLAPRGHAVLKQLRREVVSAESLIRPGEVRGMGSGRSLFVSRLGEKPCQLLGVVISDFKQRERPYYVTARCGTVVETGSEGEVSLELRQGAVHFSGVLEASNASAAAAAAASAVAGALSPLPAPGAIPEVDGGPYDRLAFESAKLDLDMEELDFTRKRLDQYSFSELLGSMIGSHYTRPRILVEIHRRLSLPFCGFLLALVAVPLSLRAAQRGRAAGTVTAMLMLGGYWCAFTALNVAAERELVPPGALWVPNAVLLGFGALGLRRSRRLG